MKTKGLFILIFLVLCSLSNCQYQESETEFDEPLLYDQILKNIETIRKDLSREYNKTEDESIHTQIYERCRDSLYISLTEEVFPAWLGTQWHFQGITAVPKVGDYPIVAPSKVDTNRIACGYFVTRILKGIGFNIRTYKLAQQPSSYIIRNLTLKKNRIYSYDNEELLDLIKRIKLLGKGVYLVGLDCHVGFLVFDGNDYFRFVHSSYYDPPLCVVSEELDSFNPFAHSEVRVIGKLFDNIMLTNWLTNSSIPIKFKYSP